MAIRERTTAREYTGEVKLLPAIASDGVIFMQCAHQYDTSGKHIANSLLSQYSALQVITSNYSYRWPVTKPLKWKWKCNGQLYSVRWSNFMILSHLNHSIGSEWREVYCMSTWLIRRHVCVCVRETPGSAKLARSDGKEGRWVWAKCTLYSAIESTFESQWRVTALHFPWAPFRVAQQETDHLEVYICHTWVGQELSVLFYFHSLHIIRLLEFSKSNLAKRDQREHPLAKDKAN